MSKLEYENQEIHFDVYYIKYLKRWDSFFYPIKWKGEGFYHKEGEFMVKLSEVNKQEIIGITKDFLEFIKSEKRK